MGFTPHLPQGRWEKVQGGPVGVQAIDSFHGGHAKEDLVI
jgi:hypothetical protein